MSAVYGAALSGLQNAHVRLEAASQNIAHASDPQAKAVRAEGQHIVQTQAPVDLPADLVELTSAKTQMQANAQVVKSTAETEEKVLNLLG